MSKIFKRNKRIDIRDIEVCLKVTDEDSLNIIKSIGINEEDLKYLRAFKKVVDKNIDTIVDEFYKPISSNKKLVDIINSHSSISKLKRIISVHLCELFHGSIDNGYINMRSRIAGIHLKIGLSISDYIESFNSLDRSLFDLLEKIEDSDDRISIYKAIQKILTLEKQLVINSFNVYSSEISNELRIKSEQLNGKISESSTTLSSLSQQLNASMETIGRQADNVVSDMKDVVNINQNVEDSIIQGRMSIESQRNAMIKLIDSSRNISNDLQNLKNMSLKVEEIVATISDISSRTNLLALNAQIEASRANTDGTSRAFGVIASQLRELSENVSTNVGHIEYIVKNIQDKQDQLESTTASLSEVVDENRDALNKTEQGLRNMTDSVHDSLKLTDNIDEQMIGLNETLQQLSEAFEVIVLEAEKLNELTLDLR